MPRGPHTDAYERLRSLLLERRKSAGLTQVELAKRLDRPQSFVAKYEIGERRLDVIEFIEVTSVIGCDPLEVISALRRLMPH